VTEGGGARPTVAAFVADVPLEDGATAVSLGEDAAHHARVRRLAAGDAVSVRDGRGAVADGTIRRIARAALDVDLTGVRRVPPPPAVHLLAPVGDRDRMLWLAEKATELGLASWRAVAWRRSRSVTPRGEGAAFAEKVRARMAQALAQSEGAWLPAVLADAAPDAAAAACAGLRLVLDADGDRFDALGGAAGEGAAGGVTLALGPEGGLEPDEVARLADAGFRRVRLPGNILRFETAGAVGVAFARALLERGDARAASTAGAPRAG
jgi:16S rRNA (uracil1498-N3)-methyltransferase